MKRSFNLTGEPFEPFELPPGVAGWRVLRPRDTGKVKVIWLGDPVPLAPPDGTTEPLRRRAGAGRYRIDPRPADGRAVDAAEPAAVDAAKPAGNQALVRRS